MANNCWSSRARKNAENSALNSEEKCRKTHQLPNRHTHRHVTAQRNNVQISRANCAGTSESTFT